VAAQRNDPGSLWYAMQHFIRLRKNHPVLADGELIWLETGNKGVLAFERRNEGERLLVVYNLSPSEQRVELAVDGEQQEWKDLISGNVFTRSEDLDRQRENKPRNWAHLWLGLSPYQYLWMY
jgi:hypothetical protein